MNIIITGASRGIGYELVKLFAENADYTIIALSRDSQKLNQLQKECQESFPLSNVIPIPYDLTDKNAKGLTAEITKHCKTIDLLINNAGQIVNKPFINLTLSDFETVYATNVFGVAKLIQDILPLMVSPKRGHIVNISSMGGVQGSAKFAGLAAYSSSKAAVACLTECLAEEFKDRNISFNCLALGAAQTEMLEQAFPGYKAPVSAQQMAEFIGNFAVTAHHFMNGKIVPVSISTP